MLAKPSSSVKIVDTVRSFSRYALLEGFASAVRQNVMMAEHHL